MTCPNCNKVANSINTTIRGGELLSTCEHCRRLIKPSQLSAKNNRERQKKDYRGELMQPTEKRDYAALYPEQAREMWGDDAIRKL